MCGRLCYKKVLLPRFAFKCILKSRMRVRIRDTRKLSHPVFEKNWINLFRALWKLQHQRYRGSRYLCSFPLLLIEVHKTLNKYQNVEMQYRPEGRFLFFVYKTVFRSLKHILFTRKVIKVSGSVIKVSGSHCKCLNGPPAGYCEIIFHPSGFHGKKICQ